jgi:hypothetical protein
MLTYGNPNLETVGMITLFENFKLFEKVSRFLLFLEFSVQGLKGRSI